MIKDIITNIILIVLIILTIFVFIMLFGKDLGIVIDIDAIKGSITQLFEKEEEEPEEANVADTEASESSEEETVTVASMYDNTITIEYELSDEVLYNPLMGFAPNADSDEGTDVNMDKVRLVYIEVTWAEFEPEQGIYDFEKIETDNHLQEWRNAGKNAVLRFVCDVPSDEDHMDIPDWVYKMTKDGKKYDMS
jgi:flagellar basal body-associated protein FliL